MFYSIAQRGQTRPTLFSNGVELFTPLCRKDMLLPCCATGSCLFLLRFDSAAHCRSSCAYHFVAALRAIALLVPLTHG